VVVEMIHIETARRLHAMHGVDTNDIDNLKILNKLRVSHNTGLQWEESQRFVVVLVQELISDSAVILSLEMWSTGLVPPDLRPPERNDYLTMHLIQII
jgi:hypothetical protein